MQYWLPLPVFSTLSAMLWQLTDLLFAVSMATGPPPWLPIHLSGLMSHQPLGSRCGSLIYRRPLWLSRAVVTRCVVCVCESHDPSHAGFSRATKTFQQSKKGSVHPAAAEYVVCQSIDSSRGHQLCLAAPPRPAHITQHKAEVFCFDKET